MSCLEELKSVNEARGRPLRCPACNDVFSAQRLGTDCQECQDVKGTGRREEGQTFGTHVLEHLETFGWVNGG
eukprot:17617-Chlamydomonas_euryale.AAC.1